MDGCGKDGGKRGRGQDERERREESRQRVEIEKAIVDVRGWRYEESRDML